MADDLPGLSSRHGAGKPLDRREWAKRKKRREALDLWDKGQGWGAIKRALNLRSEEEARELVHEGQELWHTEEATLRFDGMQHRDLLRLRAMAMEQAEGGDLMAVDRVIKLWERLSRLKDLDEKADAAGVQQIILGQQASPEQVAGALEAAKASGAEVIDSRMPWERGEGDVIEGEADEGPTEAGP